MKRFVWTSIVCSLLSLGSFAVLMLADRRLGAALPYSIPVAFASVLALTPLLVAFAARLAPRPAAAEARPEGPVSHETGRPVREVRRTTPQGVVLLDFSTAVGRRAA